VTERGWKQLQGGFLEQLKKTIEGLLAAEGDRRVAALLLKLMAAKASENVLVIHIAERAAVARRAQLSKRGESGCVEYRADRLVAVHNN
jgi:hypothetical protein